jgi:uncharacterized protein (TIGR02265 family)
MERSALRLADEPRTLFEPFAPPSNRVAPLAYSIPPPAEPGNEAREALPPPPSLRTLSTSTACARASAAPPGPRRSSFDAIAPPPPRDPDVFAPVDLDAHLALLPSGATCKGMFFKDLLAFGAKARSPGELAAAAGIVERRYLGFGDYPTTDILRLTIAVAREVYPALPIGEALRRIGHRTLDLVLDSHIGRTLVGVFGADPEPLLLHGAKAYGLLLSFGEVTCTKSGPGEFIVRAERLPLFLETYQVGVLEGMLAHARARADIAIDLHALDAATLRVRLD